MIFETDIITITDKKTKHKKKRFWYKFPQPQGYSSFLFLACRSHIITLLTILSPLVLVATLVTINITAKYITHYILKGINCNATEKIEYNIKITTVELVISLQTK